MSNPYSSPKPTFRSSGKWLTVDGVRAVFVHKVKDKPEVTYPDLIGVFKRLWLVWDDGNPDKKIQPGWRGRCEILNEDKNELFELQMSAQVFTWSFASCIQEVKAGEVVYLRIEPGQNETSFCHLAVWRNDGWVKIRGELDVQDKNQKFEAGLEIFRNHPAYSEPTAEEKGEAAEFGFGRLAAACQTRGWPHPEDAKADYILLLNERTGDDAMFSEFDEVPAAVYESITKDIEGGCETPKAIRLAMARAQKAAGNEEPKKGTPKDPEYDPFQKQKDGES